MIRGIAVALLDGASAKLSELQMQRDASLDASRSANTRLQALPRDGDQRMRDRLAAEQGKHAERHRLLSRVVSACNQFWMELRPGTVLEPAQTVAVTLKSGETVATAIAGVREEIKTLRE